MPRAVQPHHPRRSPAWRAYAALALAVAGIAWSAIFVRWAGVPGIVSAFYRVLIAAVVLGPWRLTHAPFRPVTSRAAWLAAAGGAFFAVDLGLWNTSVMHTQAAIAALLGNNTPIFVGLLTWTILGRRPGASFWFGLLLAFAGCVLVALPALHGSGGGSIQGDALALTACVFFAAYLLTTERTRTAMDTLTFSAISISASVLALFVVCLVVRAPMWGFPPRAWLALLGLGLISQLAAYFMLVYALGRLPATVTSVGLLVQVPCTALLAIVLLHEPLSSIQLTGGLVVLAGVFVVTRGQG